MAVILVPLAIILGTFGIGHLLRKSVVNQLPKGLVKSLALDAVLAFELCGTSFEMGVIYQHYGLVIWTLGLFLGSVYQLIQWKGLPMPSPITHLMDWMAGKKSINEVLIRNLTLLGMGLLTYKLYNTTIWNLQMTNLHLGRSQETAAGICVSPWESVPLWQSFLAELVGTFLLGLMIQLITDNPTLANNDPIYSVIMMAVSVCITVHGALMASGGLFNPMLATTLFGGCLGHSHLEHFIIYWIGSSLGAILGHYAYPRVQAKLYPQLKEKAV